MTDKNIERQRLANIITQWNQDHYDLFELSQPNEDCEFHGVVRFYFQDGNNVVTKCIRVASSATTQEVVDVLVEKFRPDMRMLTANKYALYEVHANGEERKLDDSERVLWVQLNWGTDVREGRFLLKRQGDTTVPHADNKENQGGTFKRKLSKREKKEAKKKEKEKKILDSGNAAEQLYTDMPETRFTRSISNPEAVMKRRRQQKVEKKLQQCRGQDGQGGTLKIYGESIKPDIPYKTLLLSTADNVRYVIKETMDKYGMDFSVNDPDDFCLVQVLVPPGEREYHGGNIGEERIMEDHECPLAIAMDFPPTKGTMMFHFRRRNDAKKPKHKKLRAVSHEELRMKNDDAPPQKLPYLVELNPDGSDNPKGKVYRLNMKFTEVGSDPSMFIKVQGPNIQPRHCVLGLVEKDGVVTVTPRSPESETHVNNQRISETTTLQNGMTVRFGKLHVFRFIDPNFEEKLRKGQIPPDGAIQKHRTPHQKPMETNFDAARPVPAPREPRPQEPAETQRRGVPQPMGSPRREEPAYPPHRQGGDLLPAVLEFREDKEDHFFANVVLDSATAGLQFKLAPTYTIYMAVRFSLSNGYRPDLSPQDKALKITDLVIKIANLTHQAIHSNRDNPAALAFWMANSSEILHFFKQDHDIHPFSQDAQEMLAESVQMAFHHLVRCLQYDLQRTLPAFLDDGDEEDPNDKSRMQYNRGRPTLSDVLDTLSSAMNLLRRCRVNAALTIQLFSQLFHFINMWLFNILVKEQHQFCMRIWGVRLKRRLGSIEAWAEKQGLELAADCHLCRIIQAAHLLQAPKSSHDDISNISSTCFKLNSLQLRELLQRYIPEPGEPPIPQSLIEDIVKIAENMADELTKNDGREVCLEEHADLQLPFLLPEDGYTCDTIKGIPKGIDEFIEPLAKAGLCRLIPQPGASGDWTVYMTGDEGPKIDEAVRKGPHQPPQQQAGHHGDRPQQQLPKEPEIATVSFNKVKGSMGLSIVEATPKGDGQKLSGIYIKSVVPGGAAAIDGRLQAGDQLLEVDGKGLVGLSQDKAAELMTRTGQTVTLKVVKQGAFYHGLATLLSQPSPVMPRASPKKPSSPQSNKHRPQEEGPPPYNAAPDMDRGRPAQHGMDPRQKQSMQSPHNRSSPALNKYRSGISSKEMEMIYGRKDALWRIILEADLHAVIGNRKPDPESAPGAFSYQNPRSKSASDLEEEARVNIGIVDKIAPRPASQSSVKPQQRRNHHKRKSVVDLRELQADLKQYRSQGQEGHRPRSKSVGEMQRPRRVYTQQNVSPHHNSRQYSENFPAHYDNRQYSGNTPQHYVQQPYSVNNPQSLSTGQTYQTQQTMNSAPVDKSNSRSSFQNLKARHSNRMKNNGLQRSQSVGSVDREQNYNPVSYTVYSKAVTPPPYNPQGPTKLVPQHVRSHSASHMDYTRPSSPYKQTSQGHLQQSYQGHPQPSSQGHSQQVSQSHGRQTSQPLNWRQPPQRVVHHQRSRSSDLHIPSRGDFYLGESYDSARGSDSLHSYGVLSPVVSYNMFKASMKNTNSDSGISDSRESKNSNYDSGEPLNSPYPVFSPVSPHTLNSTMRDSWDRSSLSSSANSTMLMSGHGSLPRKNQVLLGRGGRESMMPGGRQLRDQPQHSPHRPPHHRDPRDHETKSKSMANLHMDNSFDHRDPQHHQHNMRPAASVGALQNPNVPFQDYYNQGRNDPRGNDYENHPSVDPRIPRNLQDPMRNLGYTDVNHNVPPGHFVKPQLRETVEQGSPSSRHSGASSRDERPQSAYYPHQHQPDFVREERPKSMEVNVGKMQEMHQRYGQPQHSPHQSPHERSFDNERDPNYMNMRAQQQQQQQMQSGYVNQSDIPRYTASNESRQLNFYENTSPRQNEPSPAFHQLKPAETDVKRPPPQTMPKPSVAPKPNAPKVTPANIPRVEVDNRQTQSHFFEPKIQQQPEQRSPKVPSSQPGFIQGRGMPPHSAGYQSDPRANSLPRGKFTPPRDNQYPPQTHQSPELPPPPQEIPPELPPPPAPEDLPEELPPLPPPPAGEYSLDPQYANSTDPRFGPPGGFQQQGRFNQPKQRVQPQQQRNMGYVEPQQQFMQQPPHSATLPNRFQQPSNDYQNILYEKQNRTFDSSLQQPANQNLYESYDPKARSLPPMKMDPQLSKHRLMSEVTEVTQRSQKDGGPLVSPWDREEQEKLNKAREEEMSRLREQEIIDLESRPYLSPQEQDRLRKLRLEQEFQRRVQECANRDEDDEDSDNEITSRTQGREFLIQTIQEDIGKAQRKLEELNQKQLYEEYEREKDRMQRLERKLEIFELEREERQQRLQKRQERKLREQEEYQRKQRDIREKQRQDYEEQKRVMLMEEEKLKKKKQEEEQRRKEMERERLRELEAQREQEEARLRAEARQRQEEHQRREIEMRERERREQEKRDQELRVREETQRLEALRLQSQPQGYNQQYANLPAHSQYGAPAPPVRGSSYDVHNMNRQNERNPEIQNGFRNMNNNNSNMRYVPETVPKKSVSFNTQLETRNTYSVGSESDRTPYASQSSYRSSTSDQNEPHSPYGQPPTPDHAPQDNVFDSSGTPQQNHVSYKTAEITPTVVGSQEVYRDPRSRIMAQKEAQSGNAFSKKPASDRMSFRDKMKFFAQEAGENTPKEKPKASKTLRNIESQLHNGK
ncbi:afadin-like isoform X2 [Saccostrea cucullata]|uniref:afadin-like isoform X2 n=1 Tax=Saccostrea cuccullata TaxID=36930 RepID=UPI002ED6198E